MLKNLIAYSFLLLPSFSYAGWPLFAAPDQQFLLANNYLTEKQCSPGKVRLVPHPVIPIKQTLCKSFCPDEWVWMGENDSQCHELVDIAFQKYEITHVNQQDGTTSYSVITASYGAFKFTFTSKPGEHWYCIEGNPDLHFVMCANDT
jgi:hypothetical protein